MNTPIFDFVSRYTKSEAKRLHMPGHKGVTYLGCESLDITEISGADSLYEANGIIKASENNASSLFGCDTYYSTEGSSQCIRAMLFLAVKSIGSTAKKKPLCLATRNAHKVFSLASALIDFDIEWLHTDTYLSCNITAPDVEKAIKKHHPAFLYLTSPDYLGNVLDIKGISKVCKKYGVMLLVDNAHGAYLKFLSPSEHPCDLGADMCASSAHKTLPVLTGGAYLHIAKDLSLHPDDIKYALSLFGSTSPSYLILQSLDLANKYIADGYKERLNAFSEKVTALKERLTAHGYTLFSNEKLKLTLKTKPYGYEGTALAKILEKENIICEFCDKDFIVFMLTPENNNCLPALENALCSIEKREAIISSPPVFKERKRVLSPREASFAKTETVNTEDSLGRVLAAINVGCPPAVPIVTAGERIDENAIECFRYYGITTCTVIK